MSIFYLIIGGFNTLVGGIFGCVVFWLIKGNIALGFASESVWHILVFAFIAGINERFIPDALSKVVKDSE